MPVAIALLVTLCALLVFLLVVGYRVKMALAALAGTILERWASTAGFPVDWVDWAALHRSLAQQERLPTMRAALLLVAQECDRRARMLEGET